MPDQKTILAEKLDNFFSNYYPHKYDKGAEIQTSKNGVGQILYLKKGLVKMYAVSLSGEELVLNVYKPGAFFPMLALFNEDQKDPYYFHMALEEVELIPAPKAEFEAFLKEEKEVMWDILSRIFRGMDGLLQRVIQFSGGDAYSRIVANLLHLAKRFGQTSGDKSLTIEFHLTHQELASHAGLTRETVSRQMKVLENQGLLHYHKNIIVIDDLKRLEDSLLNQASKTPEK